MLPGKPRDPIYRAIPDFIKRGEVVRVRTGVLSYKGKGYEASPADKTRCMFRLIRANRRGTITVSDLIANCSVSKATAQEYLCTLVNRGVMCSIKTPGNRPYKYRIINDPGPNLIRNEEKTEKLKRLREAKAMAKEALTRARESLDKAAAAVAAIEEE